MTPDVEQILNKFSMYAQGLMAAESALGISKEELEDSFDEDQDLSVSALTASELDAKLKISTLLILSSGATTYAAMETDDPDFAFLVMQISPYTFGENELDMVAFSNRIPEAEFAEKIADNTERKFAPGENPAVKSCDLMIEYLDKAIANFDSNYIPFSATGSIGAMAAHVLGKTGQDLQDDLKARYKAVVTEVATSLKPIAQKLREDALKKPAPRPKAPRN